MPVEDRRRAALRRAAAASFGEEAADTLMELVTPAGQDPATRADMRGVLAALDGLDERLSAQLVAMDQRWSERLSAMDERWSGRLDALDERWEQRAEAMERRLTASFERGLREAITAQTRALVVTLLVSVVAIVGLAFGLTS
jgi:hypothetical protein